MVYHSGTKSFNRTQHKRNAYIYDRIMLEKNETLIKIGLKIREIRESQKLSIQDLADNLDMEYNNVIRIEKGRTNFTIGTLVKIANTLGTNLKDIV